jgi:hypothetical protein
MNSQAININVSAELVALIRELIRQELVIALADVLGVMPEVRKDGTG